MTFERTWVLIFLLLPARLDVLRVAPDTAHRRAGSEDAGFLAIVLALAEPTLTVPQTKMAVAVLVDTSSSVSPQDLARASEFAAALDKARGRHWVRVLPFARSVRDLAAGEQRGVHLEPTAGEAGRATDLESSIRRSHQLAAVRSGSANCAGLRRQRERRQHHSRGLAGPASRHSHRYRRP